MHCFDKERKRDTDSFLVQMNELHSAPPPNDWSLDMREEVGAFWMALGVLCDDNTRKNLRDRKVIDRGIDNKTVGKILRLPEERVFNYFRPDYEQLLSQYGAFI